MRVLRSVIGLAKETRSMMAKADGVSSVMRYALDLVQVKLGRRTGLADGLHVIKLRDGVTISYRLNRGDLQSIREVWLDEEYRQPEDAAPFNTLVDLGSNIGLTSVWLARKYRFKKIVAVEPSTENAELVRLNLSNNGVEATVIEAAVGPEDGTAVFAASAESNMGRIGEDGATGVNVRLVSMQTIMREAQIDGDIDLLKLDIEGGEENLVDGDMAWTSQVRRIIAELHPAIIDTGKVVSAIESSGLKFIAGSGDLSAVSVMDMFIREQSSSSGLPAQKAVA